MVGIQCVTVTENVVFLCFINFFLMVVVYYEEG